MYLKILLFLLLSSNLLLFSQDIGTLSITLNKEINTGNVLVYIYNNPNGFPKNKKLAFKVLIIPANHTKSITIDNLPFNTYAIIVVHDKNNNQKMDRNWIGMPGEPYALSGKTPFRFGPPTFKDASFVFAKTNKVLSMKF